MIQLTCSQCETSFQIDEAKVPSSPFKVKCPNCKEVFTANLERSGNSELKQMKMDLHAMVKTEIENLRKELLVSVVPQQSFSVLPAGESAKRALICEPDSGTAQQIAITLQRAGYSTNICSLASEILHRLDLGFYHIVTTELLFPDDPEGGQKILGRINSRKADERRKMFVIVISETGKTIGPQSAFFHGGNILVQKQDLRRLDALLQEGLRYFQEMYGNYYQLLQDSPERL
jgi:predicted Zn finger-like uncharacterized protein